MNPTQYRQTPVRHDVSLLSEQDLYLFNEGSNYRIYEKMGGRLTKAGGVEGTCFSVWAPSAQQVSVLGSFNGWNTQSHPLQPRGSSGIWEGLLRVSARARFTSTTSFLTTRDTWARKQIRLGSSWRTSAHGLGGVGPGVPVGR